MAVLLTGMAAWATASFSPVARAAGESADGVRGAVYEAPLDTRKAGDARLVGPVSTVRTAEGVRVRFETSAPIDVEAAVLDAKGAVVRHLAAGLLVSDSLNARITIVDFDYADEAEAALK